jgi:hypothetical protein
VTQPANNASAFCRQASLPYASATDVDNGLMSSVDGQSSTCRKASDADYDCGYSEFACYIQSHPDQYTDERNDMNYANSSSSRPHQLHLSKSSPNEEEVLVATSSSSPEYTAKTSEMLAHQCHVNSSAHDGRSRIHSSNEEQGKHFLLL